MVPKLISRVEAISDAQNEGKKLEYGQDQREEHVIFFVHYFHRQWEKGNEETENENKIKGEVRGVNWQ